MTPLERIRIEKAASDCGFERQAILNQNGQLELMSATFPEVVFVRVATPLGYQLTVSVPTLLATGSGDGVLLVEGIEQLYQALQHAAATARTMPNRVADQFRAKTKTLPKSTEAERLVVQRVGQDLFRSALLDYWQGRCCVTGLAVPSLLRASHIKPWAKCESDDERLDVFNGLLLSPHLDALFDGGWISFSEQGGMLVSKLLSAVARTCHIPDDHTGVYGTDQGEKRTILSWFASAFCSSTLTVAVGGCTKSRSASRSAPDPAHCGSDAS